MGGFFVVMPDTGEHLPGKEGGAVGGIACGAGNGLIQASGGWHRSPGRSPMLGTGLGDKFDGLKAEVEYTALVSVEVDLKHGGVV